MFTRILHDKLKSHILSRGLKTIPVFPRRDAFGSISNLLSGKTDSFLR